MTEIEIKNNYNRVSNITAVCLTNYCWARGEYLELEIGKIYHVTHIGVLKSSTNIMLAEFPLKEYNAVCFELYENGTTHLDNYTNNPRFWTPYLREIRRENIPQYDELIEKTTIPAHLKSIEREYNIKILLAVESGSRAWGFESKNSDWDVRFIYIHKPEWYFRIDQQRDVIENIFEDDVDIVGWELKKALSLLKKGNVSLLEWFKSPKVYYAHEEFVERMHKLEKNFFNPVKAMCHYNRIYTKHNEWETQVNGCNIKRFLYYLRGVLACKWLEINKTLPPVRFQELLEAITLDNHIKELIYSLIEIKRGGKECDINIIPKELSEYAQQLGSYYNNIVDDFRPQQVYQSTKELDTMLYDMVIKG